jgi:hypothetical protein
MEAVKPKLPGWFLVPITTPIFGRLFIFDLIARAISAEMRQFAAPLKVSASSKSEATGAGTPSTAPLGPAKVDDISSPHELTVFVSLIY